MELFNLAPAGHPDPPEVTSMAVSCYTRDGIPVVGLHGVLDAHTVPLARRAVLEAEMDAHTRRAPGVVADLEGLSYTTAGGLGVLLGAMRRLKDRGQKIVIAGPLQDRVAKSFTLSGVGLLFVMRDGVLAAQQALTAPRDMDR